MQDGTARAKELLKTVRHATMATVNEDGSPHNTPYFFAHSKDLTRLFWRSRPDTLHSQNIARTGQLFVVLYEAAGNGSGLYIKAVDGYIASDDELDEAIGAFNAARKAAGMPIVETAVYKQSAPKFYRATIEAMWVNGADFDMNGVVTHDFRLPVSAVDLLEDGRAA